MSLPVRSCLCRRHSERFEGPFGPRQWLRLLRRSTCSKRGSVRTVYFFQVSVVFLVVIHYHSRLNSVEKAPDQRRHAWSVSSEHPGTCTTVRSNSFYRSVPKIFYTCHSFNFELLLLLFFLIKHSTKEHDESSVKLQPQPFIVPINTSVRE